MARFLLKPLYAARLDSRVPQYWHHGRPISGTLSVPGLELIVRREGNGPFLRGQYLSNTADRVTLAPPECGWLSQGKRLGLHGGIHRLAARRADTATELLLLGPARRITPIFGQRSRTTQRSQAGDRAVQVRRPCQMRRWCASVQRSRGTSS